MKQQRITICCETCGKHKPVIQRNNRPAVRFCSRACVSANFNKPQPEQKQDIEPTPHLMFWHNHIFTNPGLASGKGIEA